MKKHSLLAHSAITFLFVVLFSHCVKPPVTNPYQYEITQVNGLRSDYVIDTVSITYNARNNPVSLIGQHASTGYPYYLLGYDQQNRLRINIGAYLGDNPYYEIAHKYTHDNKKRIIQDSVFTFGHYNRNALLITSGDFTTLRNFTYDNQDRVTKVVEYLPGFAPALYTRTITYYYNAAGNAYKINESNTGTKTSNTSTDAFPVYDNKVNPHQLHEIWQFTDVDYSRNNAFVASAYNSYGLPVKIVYDKDHYTGLSLLNLQFRSSEIVYGHH